MWGSSLTDSSAKGKPDIEAVDVSSRINTLNEVMEVTSKLIIYDADKGGKLEHFIFTVRTLERLGVSAVIIEDKKDLKKNSLLVTDVEQFQEDIFQFSEKIKAGKNAQSTEEFKIIARIESLILKKALNDALSKSIEVASTALYTLLNSLPKLLENPSNNNLRKLMQVNSCLAGIAISFTKTALAHSISYPLTTNYNIAHGFAYSFTFPEILLFNSKKDDGRLLKLSNHLGYKDINYLYKELKNLFLKIDLNKRIKKKLPHNLDEVFKISNQMFNPERESNNLRMVELDDIQNILYKSL